MSATSKNQVKSVQLLSIEQVKVVRKPWGWEKWIADGAPVFPYALKEIFIKAPHKSSLQVHKFKQETNYIKQGKGFLHYSDVVVDVERFAKGGYSPAELAELVASVKKREIAPGSVFHVFPGLIHRVEAVEDLLMVESSTVELDDVFRLQDDAGRAHGKIDSEHQNAV